ncbi:STAS domain-containing protein [Streptomyces sp. KS 21]|uniref:STAS domain-containing protein n=1 Tax=Streptomyces sp. KS 21 TaxID=2485150 RepID=UPI0010625DA9|nr:STAS domain-containing protein [Streptomyces sp. KS 21]TDU80577.1 anti-anti-sigma factor [Streptomyces sp. KS 21]
MNDAILVTISHNPTGTVITVTGELDMDTCPALRQAITTAAATQAPLFLHLAGVPFMEVIALRLLLDLHRDFQQRAVLLDITGFQRQPTRLLTLTASRHLLRRARPAQAAPHPVSVQLRSPSSLAGARIAAVAPYRC